MFNLILVTKIFYFLITISIISGKYLDTEGLKLKHSEFQKNARASLNVDDVIATTSEINSKLFSSSKTADLQTEIVSTRNEFFTTVKPNHMQFFGDTEKLENGNYIEKKFNNHLEMDLLSSTSKTSEVAPPSNELLKIRLPCGSLSKCLFRKHFRTTTVQPDSLPITTSKLSTTTAPTASTTIKLVVQNSSTATTIASQNTPTMSTSAPQIAPQNIPTRSTTAPQSTPTTISVTPQNTPTTTTAVPQNAAAASTTATQSTPTMTTTASQNSPTTTAVVPQNISTTPTNAPQNSPTTTTAAPQNTSTTTGLQSTSSTTATAPEISNTTANADPQNPPVSSSTRPTANIIISRQPRPQNI